MRRWTQEERKRQSAMIRKSKPWEQSTSPRTEAGKAVVAKNAMEHGMRSAVWSAKTRMFNQLMRELQTALKERARIS